jgi:hypothetical protein
MVHPNTTPKEDFPMANNKRRKNTVRVLDPEVLSPTDENLPFNESGKLPRLHNNFVSSLAAAAKRCRDATDRAVRVAHERAALYESIADDAERAYDEARKELRDLGV